MKGIILIIINKYIKKTARQSELPTKTNQMNHNGPPSERRLCYLVFSLNAFRG